MFIRITFYFIMLYNGLQVKWIIFPQFEGLKFSEGFFNVFNESVLGLFENIIFDSVQIAFSWGSK